MSPSAYFTNAVLRTVGRIFVCVCVCMWGGGGSCGRFIVEVSRLHRHATLGRISYYCSNIFLTVSPYLISNTLIYIPKEVHLLRYVYAESGYCKITHLPCVY
jgi:hypothetical protein